VSVSARVQLPDVAQAAAGARTDIIGPLPEGQTRVPDQQPDHGPGAGWRNAPAGLRADDDTDEQEGEDGQLDARAVPGIA
jgi:hypothetical protein